MKKRKHDETSELPGQEAIEAAGSAEQLRSERHEFIRGSALSVLLVVLIAAIVLGTWWFFQYTEDDGLIYPIVSAFGVDLGGMTPEEAAE